MKRNFLNFHHTFRGKKLNIENLLSVELFFIRGIFAMTKNRYFYLESIRPLSIFLIYIFQLKMCETAAPIIEDKTKEQRTKDLKMLFYEIPVENFGSSNQTDISGEG